MNPCWNRVAVAFVVVATITWLGPRDEMNALTRLAGANTVSICPRHNSTRCTVQPEHRNLSADLSVELKYGYPADDLSVQLEDSYF
jgi:hypothetical protein